MRSSCQPHSNISHSRKTTHRNELPMTCSNLLLCIRSVLLRQYSYQQLWDPRQRKRRWWWRWENPRQSHQCNVLIMLPSKLAVNRALDASPHEEQENLRKTGELIDSHPNMNIRLLWLPRNNPTVGFKRAKQLAFEAIRTADLRDVEGPHTIGNQKRTAKEEAINTWAERWYQSPRSSLAYKTALTKPPDGRTHPTFLIKQDS